MKKFLLLFVTIGLLLATTLSACAVLQTQVPTGSPATDTSKPALPNPASVYCEQNGNKLEIQTAADGSQSGICVFSGGSICDEWAYFRGECGPEPQNIPTPPIEAEPTSEASSDDISFNDGSGGYMPPGTTEEIANWWGVIKSTAPGAQYDDYFERQDFGQVITFGIDSVDPQIQSQIEKMRDSGKTVHLYGTLLSNVPDYNGSQIQVDRLEIEE